MKINEKANVKIQLHNKDDSITTSVNFDFNNKNNANIDENNIFNKIIKTLKDNTPFVAFIGSAITLIFKIIYDQISYGYSLYYGLKNIYLKISVYGILNDNYFILIIVIFVTLFIFSVIIKISFVNTNNRIKTIINLLSFSSLITNMIISFAFYKELDNYCFYFLLFVFIVIIQIMILLYYNFSIPNQSLKNIKCLLCSIILMILFVVVFVLSYIINVLILYVYLFIIFTIILFGGCFVINVPALEKQEQYRKQKDINIHKANIHSIQNNYIIFPFLIILILFALLFEQKNLIDLGKQFASNNTYNITTSIDNQKYLCLYTSDDNIIGIPIIEEYKDNKKLIKIISTEYRYIDKYICDFFIIENSHVINN